MSMIAMTIEMMAQIAVIRAKSSMYVTIAHHPLTEADRPPLVAAPGA